MIDLTQLANAFVDTFRRIPALVAALEDGDPENIFAYVDSNPDRNSLTAAIYEQPSGTVMVAWDETGLNEGDDMGEWEHRFYFTCRADRNRSSLELVNLLVDGIPNPGDGQKWRYCGVMSGVMP